MSIAIVTGSAGLIGSEAARFFARLGMDVVGIDNDLRSHFFGEAASTIHWPVWLDTSRACSRATPMSGRCSADDASEPMEMGPSLKLTSRRTSLFANSSTRMIRLSVSTLSFLALARRRVYHPARGQTSKQESQAR